MTDARKGVFIVLDGLDGSGKATQSRLLADRLNKEGMPAWKIDFPGYERNFFGAFVGECLAGRHGDFVNMDPKIASTLYACDRLESSPQIKEALMSGKAVIADRFSSSNQIHQGGKIADKEERAAFMAWLDRMEHEVLGVPRPDLIIYLRVPLEVSQGLLEKEREIKNGAQGGGLDTVEEDAAYMRQSFESAELLASQNPSWRMVECVAEGSMRSREDIHEELYAIVRDLRTPSSR